MAVMALPTRSDAVKRNCLALLLAGAALFAIYREQGSIGPFDQSPGVEMTRFLNRVDSAALATEEVYAMLQDVIDDVKHEYEEGGRPDGDERPSMHTFYDLSGPHGQSSESDKRLLLAWARAWQRAGWEPRILTMEDVRRHPDYYKYLDTVNSFRWGLYNTLCFWRWFAMATIGGGGWMSDYDVFPVNILTDRVGNNLPNGGRLTTHALHVPGLVSGSQDEWDRVGKLIVENAEQHVNDKEVEVWSDMYALSVLISSTPQPFDMTEDMIDAVRFFDISRRGVPGFNKTKCDNLRRNGRLAVHFSHYHIDLSKQKRLISPDLSMEQRPEICDEWILKWEAACEGESTVQ